jgi:hypothetical protein
LSDTGGSANAKQPIKKPRQSGWARLVSDVKRDTEERKSKKEKESTADRAAKRSADATYAIAAFTIVLAIVAVLTLVEVIEGGGDTKAIAEATKHSAYAACINSQIARDTLLQMQSAYTDTHNVASSSIIQARAGAEAEIAHVEPIGINGPQYYQGKIVVPLAVKNTGKTEAKNLVVRVASLLINGNEDPPFIYSFDGVAKIRTTLLRANEDTLPRAESHLPQLSVNTYAKEGSKYSQVTRTSAMEQQFINGTKDVLLYGKITYEDIFGAKHWTTFCNVFEGNLVGFVTETRHKACAEYSRADQNSILPPDPPRPVAKPLPEINCPPPS